jgi:hypothetical protein
MNGDIVLDDVWALLEEWRADHPEGNAEHDQKWNDACTVMAWIKEDLE